MSEDAYTHLHRSVWKKSNYENKLRELTPEEFEEFNKQAQRIEEMDDEK